MHIDVGKLRGSGLWQESALREVFFHESFILEILEQVLSMGKETVGCYCGESKGESEDGTEEED